MRTRPVGSSSLEVSVVGLGCNTFGWQIEQEQVTAVVDAAIDAGITLFDTAESYGENRSEELLATAVGGRRDRVVLATKFGWRHVEDGDPPLGGNRAYVRHAIERSLRKLRTDHVDLYQYHRFDGVTPLAETLGYMSELVDEGKVRFIGHSNMAAAQVREADAAAHALGTARFVSAQNRYSWLEREAEDDLIPACAELGLGLLPYFPLARGLLTGKYRRGAGWPAGTRIDPSSAPSPETWSRIETLESFGRERGVGLLDVAIAGLAAQPAVCSVIAGGRTPEQVRANAAAGAWEPTAEDAAALRAL